MLILWIRKNKTGAPGNLLKDDNIKSFQKHNDNMKKFSLDHPKIEDANPGDIITKEGLVLAPVHWVKLNKNVKN